MNLVSLFDKLNKIPLFLAIFLIPLFFLPFAQSVLEYPKQLLLLFLVFLSLIGWLGKQFLQGKIILKENRLLYLSLLFIFVFFSLSTIFSTWPGASFWGWPLSNTDNLFTLSFFFLFVFLFVNTFGEKEIFSALVLLLVSGTIAGIFLLFQLYGIFILPFDFFQIPAFNTLGNVSQAAIFLAVLLVISLVLTFRIKKPFFWLLLLIFLGLTILIDSDHAWIVLLFGVLTLTIFGLATTLPGKIRTGLVGFLMILLILSIFFLLFPLRFAGFPILPLEVSPGFLTGVEILRGVYTEGMKNLILGSGPGTFIFEYSKHRSPLLNQTLFWGKRFSSGNSEFLDWFTTKGLLGGISLLIFLGLIIYFSARKLTSRHFLEEKWWRVEMRLIFFASAIALVGAGFLSTFSFSLWFLFWFIVAGLLFHHLKEKVVEINSQSRRITFSAITLAIIIFGLVLLFSQSQKYLADLNYTRGVRLFQQGALDQAINSIQRATLLNPAVDIYWRDLTQLHLGKVNLLLQDQELPVEQRMQLVHENITSGAYAINQAINIAPFNVANWNVRGFFYRNLIGIEGAAEIALESYQKAAQLEPASPYAYGEIGRVYILMAQNFRANQMFEAEQEALSLAISNLEKSLRLKPDYGPAHYLLAVAYDQQGRKEEAIARLEAIRNFFPYDIGISSQLGMLYWRKGKPDLAQREFEGIINLIPDHSNARYMLGLVFDKKGEREKAKEQFKKVARLNPENQEVIKILENLQKGLPALEGIIPVQPLLGEIPPEIQI